MFRFSKEHILFFDWDDFLDVHQEDLSPQLIAGLGTVVENARKYNAVITGYCLDITTFGELLLLGTQEMNRQGERFGTRKIEELRNFLKNTYDLNIPKTNNIMPFANNRPHGQGMSQHNKRITLKQSYNACFNTKFNTADTTNRFITKESLLLMPVSAAIDEMIREANPNTVAHLRKNYKLSARCFGEFLLKGEEIHANGYYQNITSGSITKIKNFIAQYGIVMPEETISLPSVYKEQINNDKFRGKILSLFRNSKQLRAKKKNAIQCAISVSGFNIAANDQASMLREFKKIAKKYAPENTKMDMNLEINTS